jgi:hypothetical protein
MIERDQKLIEYALWICANSTEDPQCIQIIAEYINNTNNIKVTTINKLTKEQKIEMREVIRVCH